MHSASSTLVQPGSALFLDFDGTLADLANRPEAVTVPSGLLETLERLSGLLGGALAVVSGRSIAQLDGFLAPLELPAAGVHGAERRRFDGTLQHVQVTIASDVIATLQTLADSHPGILIETKPGAVALHYRLAPQLEALCLTAMHRAASYTPGCSLQLGKMVAELRPSGVSKGKAIEDFMKEAPFAGRDPVFAGDDVTDEAGFEAVQSQGGVGIKVGPGETIAKLRLPSPAAVRGWLAETCERLEHGGAHSASASDRVSGPTSTATSTSASALTSDRARVAVALNEAPGVGRLVVVSNRLADPGKPAAGGLAVALADALSESGGMWFGWSGTIVESKDGGTPGEGEMHEQRSGDITLASVDLCREDYDSYYLGYANRVLWPVFHYRLDLARFDPQCFAGYHRVNRMFARKLMTLLRDDDVIWVHDYHLIPLAAELRALGSKHRIGFFLHIPLPPQLVLAAIPGHEWLMRSMFAYDLVGFQAESDLVHFERYAIAEGNAEALPGNRYRAFGRTVTAGAFPIGIDVDEFQQVGREKESIESYEMLRDQYAKRHLLLGIDRLDYSKGLPLRIRSFKELLIQFPEQRGSAVLVQIASPSREDVEAYVDIRRELESLCGEINGDYGELDWMPIRYIHRTIARKRIPGMCRASRVALVTPLRDGMNLVAKEFVAAQDPTDPGVLVLSRFAGAAEQMREALLVNPYDIQGTAATIQRALTMPLDERMSRHSALLAGIREYDVHWWRRRFLEVLHQA